MIAALTLMIVRIFKEKEPDYEEISFVFATMSMVELLVFTIIFAGLKYLWS